MKIEFTGVYAIEAPEPCHLIEMRINDYNGTLNMIEFTQQRGADESRWQVAYDERVLDSTGTRDIMGRYPRSITVNGEARIAFFFHYLNFDERFLTPAGRLRIPDANILPKRLAFMQYEPPG